MSVSVHDFDHKTEVCRHCSRQRVDVEDFMIPCTDDPEILAKALRRESKRLLTMAKALESK